MGKRLASQVVHLLIGSHHLFHFIDFIFRVLVFRDQLIQLVVHLYPLGLDGCSLASFALDESVEHGLYHVADIHTFE